MTARAAAFTLIELLVVVTIIVVLLAMLTPAVDRAMYQAELAVCGTHLNSAAAGVILYTISFRGRYPDRPLVNGGTKATAAPSTLTHPDGLLLLTRGDLIATLRGYVSTNGMLNCPLDGKSDFEGSNPLTTYMLAPYDLWFGWQYD